MTQYVVWEALSYKKSDIIEINKFFKKNDWGTLRYVDQWKTTSGLGGAGGRNDVLFIWKPGKKSGSFYVGRLRFGIKWLGDYVNNNKDIIPKSKLEKLRMIVKRTGDYEEVDE